MDFLASYPPYAGTRALDVVRMREYPLLNAQRHVYLDYTAANVPPQSLIARHVDLLRGHVLGNPHSTNPASSLTMELVERARRTVLGA
jgi:selenocysteine lyase/cysteine desulfurase